MCPKCNSTEISVARKEEEPVHFVVLRKYRRCDKCGEVFQLSSDVNNALLLVILGSITVVVFGVEIILGASNVSIFIYCLVMIFGLRMFYAGVKGVRRRSWRSNRDA